MKILDRERQGVVPEQSRFPEEAPDQVLLVLDIDREVPKDLRWPSNGGGSHAAPPRIFRTNSSRSLGSHFQSPPGPVRNSGGSLCHCLFLIRKRTVSYATPNFRATIRRPTGRGMSSSLISPSFNFLISHPIPKISGGGQGALWKPKVKMKGVAGLIVRRDISRRPNRQQSQTSGRIHLFEPGGPVFLAGCDGEAGNSSFQEPFQLQ